MVSDLVCQPVVSDPSELVVYHGDTSQLCSLGKPGLLSPTRERQKSIPNHWPPSALESIQETGRLSRFSRCGNGQYLCRVVRSKTCFRVVGSCLIWNVSKFNHITASAQHPLPKCVTCWLYTNMICTNTCIMLGLSLQSVGQGVLATVMFSTHGSQICFCRSTWPLQLEEVRED